jgi:hypothetical protein
MLSLAKEAIDSHSLLKHMLPECKSSRMLLVRHGGGGGGKTDKIKIPKMMNATLGFVLLLHDTKSSASSALSTRSYSTHFCSGSSTRMDMDEQLLQLLTFMSTGRQYLEVERVVGATQHAQHAQSAQEPDAQGLFSWVSASVWFFDESNLGSKTVTEIETKYPTTIKALCPCLSL